MTTEERKAFERGFVSGYFSDIYIKPSHQQTVIEAIKSIYGYTKYIGLYDEDNIPTILGTSANYIIVRHGDGATFGTPGVMGCAFSGGAVYKYIDSKWVFHAQNEVAISVASNYTNPLSPSYEPSHLIHDNSFIFYCNTPIFEQKLPGTDHIPGNLLKEIDLDSKVPLWI